MDCPVLKYVHEDFIVLVKTDEIVDAWKRFQGRVNYRNQVSGERSESKEYCLYKASEGCSIFLYNYEAPGEESMKEVLPGVHLWPVIYETNKYHISIRFEGIDEGDEQTPRVRHIRRDVEKSFYYDFGRLSGEVSFLNEPGMFRMGIEYFKGGKKKEAWISFDVVSPKLDVKADYQSILKDVNKEFENLVFRYLSLTTQQLGDGKKQPLEVWMEEFEEIVSHYMKNVDQIIQNPHSRMRTQDLYAHADRIKRWTPAMEEEYAEIKESGKLEEHYFKYEVYDNTVNSLENRFVKYTLEQIQKKLGSVFTEVLNRNITEISSSHRDKWIEYQRKIGKYLRHPFFKSVGKFEGLRQESLVLQSRMGYQQVYKDWLKLRKGIDFYLGNTNVGTLQIWEIYELWCFIKVKQMVLKILNIDPSSPLVTEPNGTLIQYQKASVTDKYADYRVEIAYPSPEQTSGDASFSEKLALHAGEKISIHYQHTFSRIRKDDMKIHTLTTEQRPDIVINITKADGNVLTYLYDAKYRVWSDRNLDRSEDWYEQDAEMIEILKSGADFPPADAINQMHRYRDAIYYSDPDIGRHLNKEVIGGYILFPGRGDEDSVAKRFYSKSIKEVNIGAFPLLPCGKKHCEGAEDTDPEGPQLYAHLKDILLDRTEYIEHIENAIPQRGMYYSSEDEGDSVIFGICDRKQVHDWVVSSNRFALCIDRKRKDAISLGSDFVRAKYLVLYDEGQTVSKEVYKVDNEPDILTGEELKALGYPTPDADKYLVLSLSKERNEYLTEKEWCIPTSLFEENSGKPLIIKCFNILPPEEPDLA